MCLVRKRVLLKSLVRYFRRPRSVRGQSGNRLSCREGDTIAHWSFCGVSKSAGS